MTRRFYEEGRALDSAALASSQSSWGLAFEGAGLPVAGPLEAFSSSEVAYVISIVPLKAIKRGILLRTTKHSDRKGEYWLNYYKFEGYTGVWHPRGNNWVLWSDDLRHFVISETENSWVHVRYVLRHLIVSRLLSQKRYFHLHGAIGLSRHNSGHLFVGASGSGKSHLVRRLVQDGVIQDCLEDDCAILDEDWNAVYLTPEIDKLKSAGCVKINTLVCLDEDLAEPRPINHAEAIALANRTTPPWPAGWLPGAPPVTRHVVKIPMRVRTFGVPARDSSPVTLGFLRTFLLGDTKV